VSRHWPLVGGRQGERSFQRAALRQSTVAGHAGGPARSSAEVPVMGMEQRGRVVRDRSSDQPEVLREESRG
jgi:hypothetical protein